MKTLNADSLTSLAYGINGAGGGGNVRELYNPARGPNDIMGLVEEIGASEVPLYDAGDLKPDAVVCCVARLGRPGAKADHYGQEAAEAVVQGLSRLSVAVGSSFPAAIFPVEATAGQMARATRAARAASVHGGKTVGILDGDVCGGMAVPAVPLAFRMQDSLARFPQTALVELEEQGGKVRPRVTLLEEPDPAKFETYMRGRAAANADKMGAVWFVWLMGQAGDFGSYFTPGAVSSSLVRGQLVEEAVRQGKDPANYLLDHGEIDDIVTRGTVTMAREEHAPGFAQYAYDIRTATGVRLELAARNEYIVLSSCGVPIARAPRVLAVLGKEGPVQSHVLSAGQDIAIVSARPQSLINEPEKEAAWTDVWTRYFDGERARGTWNHPY